MICGVLPAGLAEALYNLGMMKSQAQLVAEQAAFNAACQNAAAALEMRKAEGRMGTTIDGTCEDVTEQKLLK